jgi:hypothetical protein
MKVLIAIITLLLFASCGEHQVKTVTDLEHNIAIIDGCEYVTVSFTPNMFGLSHKGNCKFCAERKKIEEK